MSIFSRWNCEKKLRNKNRVICQWGKGRAQKEYKSKKQMNLEIKKN